MIETVFNSNEDMSVFEEWTDDGFLWNFNKKFYKRFHKNKHKKKITDPLEILSKTDKNKWFDLNFPEIIYSSQLLNNDILTIISHYSDVLVFRVLNKELYNNTNNFIQDNYSLQLNILKYNIYFLRSMKICVSPLALKSYPAYMRTYSPCGHTTKKGTSCKNITYGNQKCYCHRKIILFPIIKSCGMGDILI